MSMTTMLIVLVSAIVAGVGFWFYNRRQINSLTETIEDKNAIINSFREHLSTPSEDADTHTTEQSDSHSNSNESKPEKKKKRYNNRPKKTNSVPDVEPKKSERRGAKPSRKNQDR